MLGQELGIELLSEPCILLLDRDLLADQYLDIVLNSLGLSQLLQQLLYLLLLKCN